MAGADSKTRIIAVGNQKGGVGKTTNTVHIATALGELGRQSLIWDLDMNHGATRHFGIAAEAYLGTYEVLIGDEAPENVIIDGSDQEIEMPKGVHLLPANRKLEQIDDTLTSKNKFIIKHQILIEPLRHMRGKYDYIFLDTAPNATTPTIAAYCAAEWFLLTAIPDPFAIEGLNDALLDIASVREHGNQDLTVLGVVLSTVNRRTRLGKTLAEYVEQTFTLPSGLCLKFATEISRSTIIPAAQKLGTTVFQTEPTHKVTEQYRALVREFEAQFEQLQPLAEEFHAAEMVNALGAGK
jgi:chromosome partitioning protein